MATIVNTTSPAASDRSSSTGTLIGIVMLLLVVVLFFYYGLPALRSATSGPSINVPREVDVNVNTPENPAP